MYKKSIGVRRRRKERSSNKIKTQNFNFDKLISTQRKTLSDLEFKNSFLISWQIFVFDGIWWNRLILDF